MKVISKGPGWSIKQKCTGKGNGGGGCGSELEVEKQDIYITSHTDLSGETDYYFTFTCPVCGAETDIPYNELPSAVRDFAFEKRRRR